MPQFTMWRVVTVKDVMVGHVETYLYQSQLTTWQVVAQNCEKLWVCLIEEFE